MLEINTSNNETVATFHSAVEKSLGLQADVITKREEVLIECRDIDEITTEGDICEAIMQQFKVENKTDMTVKSLRKGYGGTQIATISLPIYVANGALEAGKKLAG